MTFEEISIRSALTEDRAKNIISKLYGYEYNIFKIMDLANKGYIDDQIVVEIKRIAIRELLKS